VEHWVTGIRGLEIHPSEFALENGIDGMDVDAYAIGPRGSDAAACTARGYIKGPAMSLFGDLGHIRYLQKLQKIQLHSIDRVARRYLKAQRQALHPSDPRRGSSMSDQTLRRSLIRIANELPSGDATKRKLLSVLESKGPRSKQARKSTLTITVDTDRSRDNQPYVEFSNGDERFWRVGRGKWVTPLGMPLLPELVKVAEMMLAGKF
jgi:hypothetical protein